MSRVVIDPVTRIEGHLRIELERDERGRVRDAWASGTMVRGLERILLGRDPRDAWAFTQRICGVCTLVHGLASVRAVENALDITIPDNARLIRNLMNAAQHVHDHVMHFYHLHALDWVDVTSALKADPKATSELAQKLSKYARSSPGHFADVKQKLAQFVEAGQLGLFANGYWGHPAYKLPPEANLMAVAHYLDALQWQREVVKLHAIFGGKNPHPNFLVGGMACAISVHPGHQGHGKGPHHRGGASVTAVDLTGLQTVKAIIDQMQAFVDEVYLPDVLAIAGFYPEWFRQGEGLGNFLCCGDFPGQDGGLLVPAGVILERNLGHIHPLDLTREGEVEEFVDHAWYDYQAKGRGLHPWQGETTLHYTGPKPPFQQLDVSGAYSWLKSPRWKGKAMEVGPLARVLMLHASGHGQTRALVDGALRQLDLPMNALYSTLGRTAARAIETQVFVDAMTGWYDALMANIRAGELAVFDDTRWEPSTWPGQARGIGTLEAPRGALGHWLVINAGKIANYQAVVPTTWNAGPRDNRGAGGAYELSLRGHALHDPAQPLEVLRTIHSFDPCIACAVHVLEPAGQQGRHHPHLGGE
jgi:hydrogenase large subunit